MHRKACTHFGSLFSGGGGDLQARAVTVRQVANAWVVVYLQTPPKCLPQCDTGMHRKATHFGLLFSGGGGDLRARAGSCVRGVLLPGSLCISINMVKAMPCAGCFHNTAKAASLWFALQRWWRRPASQGRSVIDAGSLRKTPLNSCHASLHDPAMHAVIYINASLGNTNLLLKPPPMPPFFLGGGGGEGGGVGGGLG